MSGRELVRELESGRSRSDRSRGASVGPMVSPASPVGNRGLLRLLRSMSGAAMQSVSPGNRLARSCACEGGLPCASCQTADLQPKVEISSPRDPQEIEADRVADEIMRSALPPTIEAGAPVFGVARSTDGGESAGGGDLGAALASASSGGDPLSPDVRAFFEPRFGHSFSSVRIHTDGAAASLARSIGAAAYTYGNDIGFAEGRYAPGTSSGMRLLAHELTHVVQQGAADA